MVLCLAPNGGGEQLLAQLHDLLLPFREGSCDVSVRYVGDEASARLTLGPEWAVRPSRELRDRLSELLGQGLLTSEDVLRAVIRSEYGHKRPDL